ncbi:hypothetical protein ABIA96_007437, partial [Bradyrhizobium sp. LB11.1]
DDWKAKYPELTFAVIPAENASGVTERWAPFMSYLSKELGVKVTLRIANDYAAVIEGQRAGNIHIASYGSASFARARLTGVKTDAFAKDINADGSTGYYSVSRDRAFALFKGTCTRGIYDNMKTAVETIFVGKGRLYNRRFLQICSHYLVDPVACTPASGWEKEQVENQVGLVRQRFFTPRLRFKNLDELNAWLLDKCIGYAKAHRHPELVDQTIWDVFEAERPKLGPYAGRFDGFHAVTASVSKTCLVRFDNNKYSVAASAVGRPVEVQAYADRIVIRQDGRIVAEHPRL